MGKPRVLVVGTGFAGYHCLRTLERALPPDAAELVAVNPTDYMLYVPLLPEVAGGSLDPRRVAVPLRPKLPRTRLVQAHATGVDLAARTCSVVDVEGREQVLEWDRLVLTAGSVTRLLSIPGVAEHAFGFKSVAEAVFLRDHVLRQVELAEQSDDPAERAARATFVVVGAGYTGTELVAQGQQLTRSALRGRTGLSESDIRWVLVDMAPRVLPGLDERLSAPAARVLRSRGVDVRLETSVEAVTPTCARLTDGSEIGTRTVVWCVGVRPDPLVESVAVKTDKGRIVVDPALAVPTHPHVFAAGDVAAVPDVFNGGKPTPMTAQHAQRQGKLAGRNVAASLGHGTAGNYRHRDLGFVVDLAGVQAVADPLHVPLTGLPAKVVARGYHLLAMPGNRLRVAADWLTDLLARRQVVQFGLVPEAGVRLSDADKLPVKRS
ncbi:NAD(P)/FAD-dependent oxidoreductase [Saccharothrix syringae]|uniref:NAD(P)/FAD-dependent oxidoreductase n=1 Tax=Saccharothrix syringae TaxID=103733 RepID=A0A5Q0GVQ8_SACSY|nr:NAD(P)/FAD-dependent oxidoreductase [Saccharothrix syringae]QFZ18098.1 NAD(P)/FAD-dependent oxidoreductase [Saccharothrix syringae]